MLVGLRGEFKNVRCGEVLADGSWRSNMREALVDDICKGKFNEESDEISEEEAMNFYRTWQVGQWPGRNKKENHYSLSSWLISLFSWFIF